MNDRPITPDVTPPHPRELSFASLISELADGVDTWDEPFARTIARTLSAAAPHIRFPSLDALGLTDFVVTLSLDRHMRLVITADHPPTHGAFTISWDEHDLDKLPVQLHPDPRPNPYLFATLDYSVRNQKMRLTEPVPPLPEGQEVIVRVLATIGANVEYRVRALSIDLSLRPDQLTQA